MSCPVLRGFWGNLQTVIYVFEPLSSLCSWLYRKAGLLWVVFLGVMCRGPLCGGFISGHYPGHERDAHRLSQLVPLERRVRQLLLISIPQEALPLCIGGWGGRGGRLSNRAHLLARHLRRRARPPVPASGCPQASRPAIWCSYSP